MLPYMNKPESWVVVEAINSAELISVCHTKKDVEDRIAMLVNNYSCNVTQIAVFPMSAAIPFKFKQVQAVEIEL